MIKGFAHRRAERLRRMADRWERRPRLMTAVFAGNLAMQLWRVWMRYAQEKRMADIRSLHRQVRDHLDHAGSQAGP